MESRGSPPFTIPNIFLNNRLTSSPFFTQEVGTVANSPTFYSLTQDKHIEMQRELLPSDARCILTYTRKMKSMSLKQDPATSSLLVTTTQRGRGRQSSPADVDCNASTTPANTLFLKRRSSRGTLRRQGRSTEVLLSKSQSTTPRINLHSSNTHSLKGLAVI